MSSRGGELPAYSLMWVMSNFEEGNCHFSDHIFNDDTSGLDYPIEAISNSVDWANALCFNYQINAAAATADAPLYDSSSHLSTSYGIAHWLDTGLAFTKLLMGIPLYGRSGFLKNKLKNGIGAMVVAAGPWQKLSNQTGMMAYFEIIKFFGESNGECQYDNECVSTYCDAEDFRVTSIAHRWCRRRWHLLLATSFWGIFCDR